MREGYRGAIARVYEGSLADKAPFYHVRILSQHHPTAPTAGIAGQRGGQAALGAGPEALYRQGALQGHRRAKRHARRGVCGGTHGAQVGHRWAGSRIAPSGMASLEDMEGRLWGVISNPGSWTTGIRL